MRTWKPLAAFTALILVLTACTGATTPPVPPETGAEVTGEPGSPVETDPVEVWAGSGEGQAMIAEAITLAETYIAARNAYDPEAAREVLAEDATFREAPDGFRSVADLDLAFEFHQGYAIQLLSDECDVKAASPESVDIGCDYMVTTELQRIIDYPPVPGTFTFTVQEGRITRVLHSWNSGEFNPNVYNPWITDFLLREHPEFRALALASHELPPEPTREFLDLLPQYLELYEEWVNNQ